MIVTPKDFKNDDVKMTKKDIINKLHEVLPSVKDFSNKRKLKYENKYTDLAIDLDLKNYRICSIGDIHSLGFMKYFTVFQKEFFNNNGEFLIVFNELNGKPISMVIRSNKEKHFIDYSIYYTLYGLDFINTEFRYGDWLMLVEGIFDADSFRVMYKDVVAMLTSNITVMQSHVLSTLTDRFIFAFDNDEAGRLGKEKASKKLKEINPKCIIESMEMFTGDKDIGELEEKRKGNDMDGYVERKEYYRSWLNTLIH